MFFPRFVPEKHRHARFLRFKMTGCAHDGGAFGMGIGRRQKKLHCFTPKAEEFLKKVHDFVAKIPCFGAQSGCRWREVRCREALVTALHGRTMRGNTDDARERSKWWRDKKRSSFRWWKLLLVLSASWREKTYLFIVAKNSSLESEFSRFFFTKFMASMLFMSPM